MDPQKITDEMLTAYALGEVEDDAEREAIRAHLAADPEAAAQVEHTRRLGDDLAVALASEPAESLTDAQRDAITHEADRADHAPVGRLRRWAPLAAAACVLLAAGVTAAWLVMPHMGAARRSSRELAMSNSADKTGGPAALRGHVDYPSGTVTPPPEDQHDVTGPGTALASPSLDTTAGRRADQAPGQSRKQAAQANAKSDTKAGKVVIDEQSKPRAAPGQATPANQPQDGKKSQTVAGIVMDQYQFEASNAPTSTFRAVAGNPATAPQVPPVRRGFADKRLTARQAPTLPGRYNAHFNTEGYARITDNAFRSVADHPLSTFSVDVDTASYANVRRFLLREHRLPPKGAVRIEEMINYFDYHYTPPLEVTPAPPPEVTPAPPPEVQPPPPPGMMNKPSKRTHPRRPLPRKTLPRAILPRARTLGTLPGVGVGRLLPRTSRSPAARGARAIGWCASGSRGGSPAPGSASRSTSCSSLTCPARCGRPTSCPCSNARSPGSWASSTRATA